MNNQNLNDLEHVRRLRQESEMLEYKERVRSRLNQLMEISKDPYYDRYVAQMIRDLDSGRATPAQVEREAQRSYNQYKERMAQKAMAEVHARKRQQTEPSRQRSMEFKIGVHVFGFVGAIFILIAFVIFGFNFLDGLAQGLCLYGAAIVLILLSELVLAKRSSKVLQSEFWVHLLTGIGIGALYAANIVNYLALRNINEMAVMIITLLIAISTFFISRKRDSAVIKIVSLLGCYISFLTIKGFETEFDFLVATVILFVINTASIFLKSQKRQRTIDSIHILLNILLTTILTGAAWAEGLNPIYLVFYVLTSFIFDSILCLQRSADRENNLFVFGCVGNGIYIFLLFLIGNLAPGVSDPDVALFVHLLSEILILAVCSVIFLLWNKEDGRKWSQIYYIAGAVLLLSLFSDYHYERILSALFILLLAKILAGHKEMQVLDCVAVIWAGFSGLWLSDYWYCWLLAGALLLSRLRIKSMHTYHEIVITLGILAIWWCQCEFYLSEVYEFDKGWLYPVSVGILLLLFLLFNHLPLLKGMLQKPYNITNIAIMSIYYLSVWICDSYIFSSLMMVLGAVTIIIVFRSRYEMNIPRKDLLLAGFLVYFSLTGHYESPVVISILIMVIALGCVGAGFKLHDKTERICGLIMALIVCIKLVLYDFREVTMIYRMIVFLVVGVIALIISYIYIQLEKSSRCSKEQSDGKQEQIKSDN